MVDYDDTASDGRIDPRTLTIAPSSGQPVAMTAPAGVSLEGVSAGDHVSAHYTREVTFVVGTPEMYFGALHPTPQEPGQSPRLGEATYAFSASGPP